MSWFLLDRNLKLLSRMIGNFHVRFLGGKGAVMPPTYPAYIHG